MAVKPTKYDLLLKLKDYVDTIETALGNPTGDMSAVTQDEAATLAAYILYLRAMQRAHVQTRIGLVIPNGAIDVSNTAIKTELDKISTVSVLTEAGVADCQEDWNVYDLVVVGTDATTGWTNIANIDDLIPLKIPIVVCCSSAAERLLMGTAAAQSTSDLDECCESIANRVMYRTFGTTGDKEIFSENADSDRLDMSDGDLIEQILMVDTTGDGPALVVVGWLPVEEADGTINKLNDGTEIPAGRVFAGCFYNADKLTDLGKTLLRELCRNATEASITPSISLRAQAGKVVAILNDTNELQTDWHDGGRLDLLIDAIKAETDQSPNVQHETEWASTPTIQALANAAAFALTAGSITPTYPAGATRVRAILIATIHAANKTAAAHHIKFRIEGQKAGGGYGDLLDLRAQEGLSMVDVDGATDGWSGAIDVTALVDTSGAVYDFRFEVDSDNAGNVIYICSFVLALVYTM